MIELRVVFCFFGFVGLGFAMLSPKATAQANPKTPAPTMDNPKRYLSPKPKPDAVLAKVGGVPIRAQDLEGYLWDWRAYEALQDLLTHQMIVAEAKRMKVAEDPAAIDRELSRQIEAIRSRLQAGQTVQQSLLEQGFPKSRLWLRIRTEHLLDKLVMAAFDARAFVKVSTIIVRPRSEQATDMAEALRKSEEAYTSLRNGEAWGDVLARFTEDSSTLQNQGLLGWRELSAFPPTVRQEMTKLKPGAITRPAVTTHGIQIFRIEGIGSEAQGTPLQELRDAFRLGSRQKFLDELRKRTKIEVYIGR